MAKATANKFKKFMAVAAMVETLLNEKTKQGK